MTVFAEIDENWIIIDASPIIRKFIGQPSKNLRDWLMKQGGYQVSVLPDP